MILPVGQTRAKVLVSPRLSTWLSGTTAQDVETWADFLNLKVRLLPAICLRLRRRSSNIASQEPPRWNCPFAVRLWKSNGPRYFRPSFVPNDCIHRSCVRQLTVCRVGLVNHFPCVHYFPLLETKREHDEFSAKSGCVRELDMYLCFGLCDNSACSVHA